MNVRCYRCGTSFELNRAAMEEAVAAATKSRSKTHVVECVKCRQAIKVPVAQIRRFLPRPAATTPDTHEPPAGA